MVPGELPDQFNKADEAAQYGCPGAQHLCFEAALNGDLGKQLQNTANWANRKAIKIASGEIPNRHPDNNVNPQHLFYSSETFLLAYAKHTGRPINITTNEKSD